jgi:WD40 repeat protein
MRFPSLLASLLCIFAVAQNSVAAAIDYADVHAIFHEHCLDCHEASEPDGNLVLETFEGLMHGGESGAPVVAGKSAESLLVKFIEGNIERDGKKKIMPPGKREKLNASQIATIKSWIDGGALPPANPIVKELKVPQIAPKVQPPKSIHALAYDPTLKLLATARYGEIDLVASEKASIVRTLSGHRSRVNDIAFSADGTQLFSASGENGLAGELKQWNVADGGLIRTVQGHRDTIYSVAVSADGKIVATGSYDQEIKLWNTDTGAEIKTLHGHNGAVYGLAFRPDGTILASASADRTVKLWNVAKGERVDTLSQPLKDVHAVTFSADGKKLYAGGVDNRIRIWQISENALETTNPILESKFAHEGAILRLAFSPDGKFLLSSADDRTVKLWDAKTMREKLLLDKQSDWATGICFASGQSFAVGRLDGTFGSYDFSGTPIATNLTTSLAETKASAVTKK